MLPAADTTPIFSEDRVTHRQEPLQHTLDTLLLILVFECFLFNQPGYNFYLSPVSFDSAPTSRIRYCPNPAASELETRIE